MLKAMHKYNTEKQMEELDHLQKLLSGDDGRPKEERMEEFHNILDERLKEIEKNINYLSGELSDGKERSDVGVKIKENFWERGEIYITGKEIVLKKPQSTDKEGFLAAQKENSVMLHSFKMKEFNITSINNPQKISPTFYTSVEEYKIDGKIILHINIPESTHVHRTNGRIFDRNGDADIDITDNTDLVAELYNRNKGSFTETNIFPFADISDLDHKTISRARTMARNQRGGQHPWDAYDAQQVCSLYGLCA